MVAQIDVKELLEKGAYFGHKISRTNPKVLPYIYKPQNGIYLIDLFKTKAAIEAAMNALLQAGKAEETLLVVGTKRIIKEFLAATGKERSIFYVSEKWVGGFFTNFDEIRKNVKKVNQMISDRDSGALNSMIKHERAKLEKTLNKLHHIYEGVLTMETVPDNILIIDVKKEKNALAESIKYKEQRVLEGKKPLAIFGIVDTNSDPTVIDYPIVINDDSSPALEYAVSHLLDAYSEGLKQAEKKKAKSAETKDSPDTSSDKTRQKNGEPRKNQKAQK